MNRSVSQITNRRRTAGAGGWRDVPVRRTRPIMSFAEFEAVPPGFVSLDAFIKQNFKDSDRVSLSEIRKGKADEKFKAEAKLTPAILRLRKGFSQKQLADRIGTSQPAVARLEAGHDRPSFEKLNKLQSIFEVNFDQLMEALNNVSPEG